MSTKNGKDICALRVRRWTEQKKLELFFESWVAQRDEKEESRMRVRITNDK